MKKFLYIVFTVPAALTMLTMPFIAEARVQTQTQAQTPDAPGAQMLHRSRGIERRREQLAMPEPGTDARIEVREQPDAARAIAAADNAPRREKVLGYSISLFRDNNQTAGQNARSVAEQFRKEFPGIPTRVEYESPFFTVTAGNFFDKVDAIALCGKILPVFKKAVVMQEEIAVADIVEQLRSAEQENFATGEENTAVEEENPAKPLGD